MFAPRSHTHVGFLFVLVAMLASTPAAANDTNGGVFMRGIDLRPRNAVARSVGVGVDAALVPWSGTRYMDCPSGCIHGPYQPVYFSVGAFATQSLGTESETRRDLYGLRASIGLGKGPRDWFTPFGAVGLDALVVNTHLGDGTSELGPTIGADVRVGVLGMIGDGLMYAVSASYLGAVAPGSGDNAGGLVLDVTVGWRFWRGR